MKYDTALYNIHALTKSTSIYIISNSLVILYSGYSICSDKIFCFSFSFYDNFYKTALETKKAWAFKSFCHFKIKNNKRHGQKANLCLQHSNSIENELCHTIKYQERKTESQLTYLIVVSFKHLQPT